MVLGPRAHREDGYLDWCPFWSPVVTTHTIFILLFFFLLCYIIIIFVSPKKNVLGSILTLQNIILSAYLKSGHKFTCLGRNPALPFTSSMNLGHLLTPLGLLCNVNNITTYFIVLLLGLNELIHIKYLKCLVHEKAKCKSFRHVQLFVTPWTGAPQAPLSMEFSRQEYQNGLPFPSPDLPNPGMEPGYLELQANYGVSHQGSLNTSVSGTYLEVSGTVLNKLQLSLLLIFQI